MTREDGGNDAPLVDTLLKSRVREQPDAEALVFGDRRVTYAELDARVERFARALAVLGVRPGENVAVLLPDSVDYTVAVLAALRAGARAVPVNLRFKETELRHLIADSDAVLLVTTGREDGRPAAGTLVPTALPGLSSQQPGSLRLPEAPLLRDVLWLDGEPPPGSRSLAGIPVTAGGPVEAAAINADDIAMIMYTSGTTSRPKGAMITHDALGRQARCLGAECFLLTPQDRMWTPLPMFHTGGLMSLLACIATGASYVHAGPFDAGRALGQLERERITVAMPVFELFWMPVLDHPRLAEADLSSLRMVQVAAVPAKQRIMQARFPHAVIVQSSGMTESTSYFAFNRATDPEEVRLSTGGYPLPTVEVRVIDLETGQDARPGQYGETLLRGAACFAGYYNAPDLTAEVFDDDGWFHTGDIGVFDHAGHYTFVGRVKDMLKVGGENVAAAEVEDFLSQHPAVRLVQVVAAPDRRYGEVPAAFVELNPGAEVDLATLEQELIGFCLDKIATFKIPRYVRVMSAWPMSGSKVQKFRLRELIAAELAAAGIDEAPRLR